MCIPGSSHGVLKEQQQVKIYTECLRHKKQTYTTLNFKTSLTYEAVLLRRFKKPKGDEIAYFAQGYIMMVYPVLVF